MKHMLFALVIIPFSLASADVDCQALFEKHLDSDMELSYQEFDQTMDSGFRVLGAKGCNEEAADLNGYSRHPHIHLGAWKEDQPLQVRFDLSQKAVQ